MIEIKCVFQLACLTLFCASAAAQSSEAADPYAPGRALVADINRIVMSSGLQDSFVAEFGGARQVVSVRGADRANPLLVFIHGGPGAPEIPISWSFQRPWEDYFTVAQYDQRGAGRSYALNDPSRIAATLTLDRYRDDAIELIELLCRKYGKRKVVLVGHSWGSAVGLSVASKRPDLLYAYVGMGQIIDWRENERRGMAWTVEQARARKNEQALREIEALRPYPDAGPFTIDRADGWRKWAILYGSLAANRGDADFYLHAARLSPEYTLADLKSWDEGSAFTTTALWPRLANVSFIELKRLNVPVIMLIGRYDHTADALLAAEWMDHLSAPKKVTLWFEHSAHLPMVEEPGRIFAALLTEARPLTEDSRVQEKPSVEFTDYAGDFDRIEAQTRGMRAEERVAEFRAQFQRIRPGLYADENAQALDRRIAKALAEFPAIREKYRAIERQFPAALTEAVTRFRRVFPSFVSPIPIVLAHELGVRDGGSDEIDGKKVMIFGADVIATLHDDATLQPFLDHELFHLEHARHFADCDQFWCPLWQEGLATEAARTMTPHATDRQLLLDQPEPIRARTDAHWSTALCFAAQHFDSVDASVMSQTFLGNDHAPNFPPRFGYYVGLRIAQQAERTRPLAQLTLLNNADARPIVAKALSDLLREVGATCKAPALRGTITHVAPRPA